MTEVIKLIEILENVLHTLGPPDARPAEVNARSISKTKSVFYRALNIVLFIYWQILLVGSSILQ